MLTLASPSDQPTTDTKPISKKTKSTFGRSGIMIGHFEPLTLLHLQDINRVASQVDHLYLVVTTRDAHPYVPFVASLQDKARWVQVACTNFDFVSVHTSESLGMVQALHGMSYDRDLSRLDDDLASRIALAIGALSDFSARIMNTGVPCSLTKGEEIILPSAVQTDDPFFDILGQFERIAPSARPHYTQTVCIIGGESSGKTTLVHKLANHYGAAVALEMGRLYVDSHLGGTEIGLQYSDYPRIAHQHLLAIDQARATSPAPIAIIDTDFATTQAFCETYEGRTHPQLSSMVDTFRLNHTIMLDNNVPWVADGMRSLGSADARRQFADTLKHILMRHNIHHHTIDSPNYHERYLAAVDYIDHILSMDWHAHNSSTLGHQT